MKVQVRRPHPGLSLTPETTAGPAYRVSLRCGKCRVPVPISITPGRYGKFWTVDWATIFERVRFRCRCGSLADRLKVDRQTRDQPQEVLMVWTHGEYHG